MGDEADIENLASILSQNSLDEENECQELCQGLFFSELFFSFL